MSRGITAAAVTLGVLLMNGDALRAQGLDPKKVTPVVEQNVDANGDISDLPVT